MSKEITFNPKSIMKEVILFIIAWALWFGIYMTYNKVCDNYVLLNEISSTTQSINEYLNEPVAEVTEEQYEAILNAIK